jgi:hypothetical protein
MLFGCFSIKKLELPPVCDGLFVYSGWLEVIYDSQVTNSSVAGGGGFSQGVHHASY